ncbi:unnamed protein product [Menidia menidia]|uniref:(Atlantic silverside) hypothetical protein n=1 Tax=Menidia menidia TaxID=238744 RepID=A0A8S4AVW6_9TELE|nr:unnamed protein product [Menidia menidia]
MRASQMCGSLSAFIRAIFIIECLPTVVRGDGPDPEEPLDLTFVLIGVGIGLLFVAAFILSKFCLIRKQAFGKQDCGMKRPSEPNMVILKHLSQSQHSAEVVSSDMQG